MNLSPPIPWRDVPRGAVVLYGIPRRVLVKAPYLGAHGLRSVLLEGVPPFVVNDDAGVQLVLLDDADAVANLAAAGLNPEPIEENPTT